MSINQKILATVPGVIKWIALSNAKVQSEQILATILSELSSQSKTEEQKREGETEREREREGEREVLSIVNVTSPVTGSLKRVVKEGAIVKVGENIAEVFSCSHPAVFRGLCVSCGSKITSSQIELDKGKQSAHNTKFTMVGGQTIQLSQTEAKLTQSTKIATLQKNRKLALILDLDSTLVHATPFQPFPQNILDQVRSIQLEENGFILR